MPTKEGRSERKCCRRVPADALQRTHRGEPLVAIEARLRQTLDYLLEGCQIIGFDWRYLYVNNAVARQGRRAKEELLGHKITEVYPDIHRTELFDHLRRCMEERTPQRVKCQFTYPDGDKGWFEVSIQPVLEGILVL